MKKVYAVKGFVKCHWCPKLMRNKFTVDRLDPKGTYKWENIVPACETCNKGRRRTPLVDESSADKLGVQEAGCDESIPF